MTYIYDIKGNLMNVSDRVGQSVHEIFLPEQEANITVEIYCYMDGHHLIIKEMFFDGLEMSKEYIEERVEDFRNEFDDGDYIGYDHDFDFTDYNKKIKLCRK